MLNRGDYIQIKRSNQTRFKAGVVMELISETVLDTTSNFVSVALDNGKKELFNLDNSEVQMIMSADALAEEIAWCEKVGA